jgi:peptidoglycan hydrolase-like protein with peptidoglycan-binding domain
VYGPITAGSIRALQKKHGLPEDGIYGPKTKLALTKEIAETSNKLYKDLGKTVAGAIPGIGTLLAFLDLYNIADTAAENVIKAVTLP